jgi:hypothetical protein
MSSTVADVRAHEVVALRVRELGRTPVRGSAEGRDRDNGLMTAEILPLRFLLLTFAGWVNRQHQQVLD